MSSHRSWIPVAGAAALLLSGIASSSQAHDLVDVAPSPETVGEPLPDHAVARVGTRLVSRRAYRHWFRAAANHRRPKPGSPRHIRLRRDVMEFLIDATWIKL